MIFRRPYFDVGERAPNSFASQDTAVISSHTPLRPWVSYSCQRDISLLHPYEYVKAYHPLLTTKSKRDDHYALPAWNGKLDLPSKFEVGAKKGNLGRR